MTVPSLDAPVTALPIAEGLLFAGTAGVLLALVYTRTARRIVSRIASLVPSRSRTDRPVLFGDQSTDDAWSPGRLPVEPDENVYYTDEERVLRLLIVNQGRMKQSAIVRETGWSSAKVSRLLHRMETRNDVSRVPAGRSKVVYLGHYRTDDAEPTEPLRA